MADGLRILVAEDEAMIAVLLESTLQDAGFSVVGPFFRLPDALAAAEAETVDLAVLDVNLAGEKVFPVAEALERRGVPFLLLSGYGDGASADERQDWPRLGKPYRTEALLGALTRLLPPA